MDYARIYREFVADRLNKQPEAPTYFERHHILPRSLGGGDEPDNMIRLTPEDHYFAHLCLAKAHGGRQWAGVLCMTRMLISKNRRQSAAVFSKRRMVGIARRKHAEHRSSSQSGVRMRHTRKAHTIYHVSGKSMTGALADLADWTGVSFASISRLASRKQGMTYNGWFMFSEERSKAVKAKRDAGISNSVGIGGHNRKAVMCNETGEVFDSIVEASRAKGVSVKNAFKPGRAKAGGFTWSFV